MAKFVYKMQNILDIKYKLEAQARSDYAIAAARVAEEEEKLAHLYLRRRNYEKERKELLEGKISVTMLRANKTAIDSIKSMIRDQANVVHKAQKELEVYREKLNEIMVDRKTHEKLKENRFEEFKKELNAEEYKDIDQLVSYNFNKQ